MTNGAAELRLFAGVDVRAHRHGRQRTVDANEVNVRVSVARLLSDTLTLDLPVKKPDVVVPVVELVLKD